MKKFYFLFLTLGFLSVANAQLQSGDIAFTGYTSDAPDSFSFVTFVDIPAGVSIEFTDNGWQASGDFRANEGTGTWTSPGINAGDQVIVSDILSETVNIGTYTNNGMNLSGSGDQILAYDPNNIPGGGNDTGFYAGIHMNGNWDSDATSSNTSALPNSITNFSIAIDPEVDNAVYDCTSNDTEGTVEQLRSFINNQANWTTSNSTSLTSTDCGFVIATLSNKNFETAEFSVYPNPVTNGFVNIKTTSNDAINVTVFDVLGKQVVKQTLTTNRLNVSNLKAGMYLLNIEQNGASTTKKLVIE
ncbi:T9SS type A sorting domain-containing protein [Mesoflavibacter zeaxanthinifaciens]|uniref:T9SS type A sorting domain-containing protein n=1 Tax=Mesoflavibacter zeaxanthinifaciens TaxID=393060 RepID=UPI003A95DDCB